MKYNIFFRDRAKKVIKSIPKKDGEKMLKIIHLLSSNPYPNGFKKLKNRDGYRIRIGNYRVIYEIKKEKLS